MLHEGATPLTGRSPPRPSSEAFRRLGRSCCQQEVGRLGRLQPVGAGTALGRVLLPATVDGPGDNNSLQRGEGGSLFSQCIGCPRLSKAIAVSQRNASTMVEIWSLEVTPPCLLVMLFFLLALEFRTEYTIWNPSTSVSAWLWSRFPEIRSEICDARKKTVSGNFQGNL